MEEAFRPWVAMAYHVRIDAAREIEDALLDAERSPYRRREFPQLVAFEEGIDSLMALLAALEGLGVSTFNKCTFRVPDSSMGLKDSNFSTSTTGSFDAYTMSSTRISSIRCLITSTGMGAERTIRWVLEPTMPRNPSAQGANPHHDQVGLGDALWGCGISP
ncbi:MAG: hypothetical protein IPJ85_07340 [Flavobacteriales bacterium]|nr:hypothetical protein [Flavobacteriales bacterium]